MGIELKNENKTDEMCQIMDSLHKYVPSIAKDETLTLPNGELLSVSNKELWETLFGGDQLTVVRARGAIDIRDDHNPSSDKLRGLLPVIEDWHSRMTILKVSDITW